MPAEMKPGVVVALVPILINEDNERDAIRLLDKMTSDQLHELMYIYLTATGMARGIMLARNEEAQKKSPGFSHRNERAGEA